MIDNLNFIYDTKSTDAIILKKKSCLCTMDYCMCSDYIVTVYWN